MIPTTGKKIKGYKYPKHKITAMSVRQGLQKAGTKLGGVAKVVAGFGTSMAGVPQAGVPLFREGLKDIKNKKKKHKKRISRKSVSVSRGKKDSDNYPQNVGNQRKFLKHKVMCKKKHKHSKMC